MASCCIDGGEWKIIVDLKFVKKSSKLRQIVQRNSKRAQNFDKLFKEAQKELKISTNCSEELKRSSNFDKLFKEAQKELKF
jgi:hypothetical protein